MSAHKVRVRQIHRGVVTAAVAVFLVVWLIVAVQMAGGHDPALASSSHRLVRGPQAPQQDGTPRAEQQDPAPDYSAPADPAPSGPAPLTTQQS